MTAEVRPDDRVRLAMAPTLRVLWPVIAALAALWLFRLAGQRYFDNYLLDLGSIWQPTPRYVRFVAAWALCGGIAAAFLALGIARYLAQGDRWHRIIASFNHLSDRQWVALGAIAAFAIPLALRRFVLAGAPLTDDETAYQFMAQLLGSGRLRVASPPLKLFFDQAFMINDGHLYPSYFVGWPALMTAGMLAGAPGVMNPLYSAFTVPAMFLVLRRVAGSSWARLGVVLYLAAPMLMVGAATLLAHTSCVAALAWTTWFFLRSRDQDSPWWSHAGLACFFGIAFWIRPSSALGIGLPMLLAWARGLTVATGRTRQIAAFGLPACCLAGLFFAVNWIQNGSITLTGYQRYQAYMFENGYRFSYYGTESPVTNAGTPGPQAAVPLTTDATEVLANVVIALFRLNFDLFGWPSSFLFAVFAGVRGFAGLNWLSFGCFLLLHARLLDGGIDSFGPVHYFETAWPLLILTILGLRAVVERWPAGAETTASTASSAPVWLRPVAAVSALVLVTLAGFVPVRIGTLARLADNINMPFRAVAAAGLHDAVVFSPLPFAPSCRSWPTRHFVFWRPANDPDLKNPVLWVNHISVEQDRRLMEHFPDRTGYVMLWVQPCDVALLPLSQLEPGSVPGGNIGGTGEGPC